MSAHVLVSWSKEVTLPVARQSPLPRAMSDQPSAARTPGLILTLIKEYLLGSASLDQEILEVQRCIAGKHEVIAWNCANKEGTKPRKVLHLHYAVLKLEQKLQSLRDWQHELEVTEALIMSMLVQ
jgi:hypothetical protein